MDRRKRRADLAFSAMKVRSRRAASIEADGIWDAASSPPRATGIRKSVPRGLSDNGNPLVSEHFDERDQGQSDQRAGVGAFHAFDEHDADPLDLGATGAVIGAFRGEVTLDLGVVVVSEPDGR